MGICGNFPKEVPFPGTGEFPFRFPVASDLFRWFRAVAITVGLDRAANVTARTAVLVGFSIRSSTFSRDETPAVISRAQRAVSARGQFPESCRAGKLSGILNGSNLTCAADVRQNFFLIFPRRATRPDAATGESIY